MTEMAAKGFTATQVIAAMPGVIAASEASGESLALTADTVATALNVWGLEAGQAGKVADILAMSANVSAAGIDDLGFVLKYAGAPAAALGISLEELAAAAGLMTDAGLNGSNAGTSLRASLLALNNPAKAQARMMKELGFTMQDSEGNTKNLAEMIRDMTSATEDMSEADKVATLGKLVGTEAVSGFLALMKAGPDAIYANTVALENSAGASQEAADKMMAGIGGALEEMSGAFESAAILIGDQLTPYIQKFAETVGSLVDKFNEASPAFQKFAVIGTAVMAGLMLIVGPILLLIGFIPAIISGLGAIATVLGVAGGAAGLFAAAMAVITGPIGLIIAGVAALTVAGIALANHLKKDAIPEIDRFGKGVSDATKEALGGFFDLSDGASQSLAEISYTSSKVTGEMATDLIGKYSAMNKQILDAMNERHTEQEASMKSFFLNSSVLTDEEEAKILQKQENSHDLQVLAQESKESRIKAILESATNEKRSLTDSEKAELNNIQQSMNENAVKYLSKSEVDQKIIMEKMKQSAGDLSAKQAAEVVKNSAKQRNDSVKEAEGQYTETIGQIIRMRDETGEITDEQATKMIEEATRARDGAVKQAEIMHGDVVKEAKEQAGEHVDHVNWETGEVLSKWDVFKNNMSAKWEEMTVAAGKWIAQQLLDALKGYNDIRDSIKEKMDEVKKKIEDGWKEATAFLNAIDLKQIGKDIVAGLIKGISDKFEDVKAKVSELADSIPDWAKKILGIHSPSRVMAVIGGQTGDGLANGIAGTKSAVTSAITGLTNVIKSVTKSTNAEILAIAKTQSAEEKAVMTKKTRDIANIHAIAKSNKRKLTVSESQRIAKIETDSAAKIVAIQRKHSADVSKINSDLAKDKLAAIKTYVDDKKSLEQLSLVAETEVWRKSVDMFTKGTKERVEAQKAYQASLKAVNDEVVRVNDEYASKMGAINERLRKDEEELTSLYTKSLGDRMKSLMSFAGLFDEFDVKVEQSGSQLLANLGAQVDGFKLWQTEIEKLAGKAIDEGLIAELREMGPKALPQLLALNSMTDAQMSQYSALYAEKSKLARTQAEAELVGMKTDTATRITELRAVANTELETLREEWVTKIKAVTKATNDELLTLKTIGANAGKGLMDGLASMEPALVSKARSIAEAVKAAMAGAFDIHSPSRWMRDFIGVNMMTGWIDGVSSMRGDVLAMSANASGWMTPAVPQIAGYQTPKSGAGVGRSVMKSDSSGGNGGGTTYTGPVHVTIDAKNVAEFNSVVEFMADLPQQLRKR